MIVHENRWYRDVEDIYGLLVNLPWARLRAWRYMRWKETRISGSLPLREDGPPGAPKAWLHLVGAKILRVYCGVLTHIL